ncbi:MAG: M48 family metallopeptidase [Sulfurihydrogenibium sp.]|nr:M48 family metallopeptidase [Sulfurihydrogenibium sp.]
MKVQVLRRKEFRSLSITVERDGTVTVKAPLVATDEEIKQFIEESQDFVRRVVEKYKEYGVFKEYKDGETFLYLGENKELKIVDNQVEPLVLKDKFYLSSKVLDQARDVFLAWYKKQASKVIADRVKYYALLGGYTYNKIAVKDLQKVWGSCSSRKNLSFNWRIIMAPLDVIDYVVVHELSHLREFNHTQRFWNQVAMLMPDYEEKDMWLRRNGHLLDL